MTGTLVNAAAIAAGGCVGLLLKKGVKGSHQDSINKALGVAVLVLGLNGVISSMFTVNADGTLASSGELLLIISLVLGTLAGEALRIDDRLNGLSGLVERRLHLSGFAQSFVNGALIYCVGAMAIIGALNDGLRGDASVLYIKSLLDGISSVVLGATLGPGVIFAALPVLVYQGAISLLAGALEPFLAGELLGQICGVGYCLVLCIGINFLGMTKIKTANMLPALLVPVLWSFLQPLFSGAASSAACSVLFADVQQNKSTVSGGGFCRFRAYEMPRKNILRIRLTSSVKHDIKFIRPLRGLLRAARRDILEGI